MGATFFVFLFLIVWGIYFILPPSEIVVGTINQENERLKNLSLKDNKVIYADDFRNQGIGYRRASWISLKLFLVNRILLKKVKLFTSNPLYLKFRILFVFFGILVLDNRVNKKENIEWVKNLSEKEILENLPEYFEKDKDPKFKDFSGAEKRRQVYLNELINNYSKDRFKEKKYVCTENIRDILKIFEEDI